MKAPSLRLRLLVLSSLSIVVVLAVAGVSVATIVGHDGATLLVRGLDAIDGTPILDIKPYLPEYDSVPEAHIPGA